jgi:GAF domain-containing protein
VSSLIDVLESKGGALTLSARALRMRLDASLPRSLAGASAASLGVLEELSTSPGFLSTAVREIEALTGERATVSVLIEGSQVVLGSSPDAVGEGAPLEWTACLEVLESGSAWSTHDMTTTQRAGSIQAVQAGFRAYVGVPVRLSSGEVIGTCCALSRDVRHWSEEDVEALAAVATELVRGIEGRAL